MLIGAEEGQTEELERLLELYREGCCAPSPYQVESAFAYAKQVVSNRGRGRKPPISSACGQLQTELENGYEPEKTLLYRDTPAELILDHRFEQLCQELIIPLLDRLRPLDGGSTNE